MDVKEKRWYELEKAAGDRDKWCARVRALKVLAKRTTKPKKQKLSTPTTRHSTAKARFTFFLFPASYQRKNKTNAEEK